MEQAKTKPQEVLDFKKIRSKQTFSFNPPINPSEEGKWLLRVTLFDCTKSVFKITDENNSFSITTPSHWNSESAVKTIDKPNKLIDLRSENGIDLHVEQVRKKGILLINDYSLSSLSRFKNEVLEELKTAKYNDLEDMINRYQLTYVEIIDILDLKYIPTSNIGYTLPPNMYKIIVINFVLKSLLPKEVKVNITIDDVKLKSNLTTIKTIRFTKMSFHYVILGFTQSHSGELGDIPGFIQRIPGSFKSDKPINISVIDKVHLNCDCINGSIVNGVREPILYSFALEQPPGHEIYKEPRIKFF